MTTTRSMLRLAALLALASAGCSSGSGASASADHSDSGGDAGPRGGLYPVSCAALCDHVAATVCPGGEPVQSAAECRTECAAFEAAATQCPDEYELFADCCVEEGLAAECAGGLSFGGSCHDVCKGESDMLKGCESGALPPVQVVGDPRSAEQCARLEAAQCPGQMLSPARCVRVSNYQTALSAATGCQSSADALLQCVADSPVICGNYGATVQGCEGPAADLEACWSR